MTRKFTETMKMRQIWSETNIIKIQKNTEGILFPLSPCLPFLVWPSFLQLLSHKCASYLPVHRCLEIKICRNISQTREEPIFVFNTVLHVQVCIFLSSKVRQPTEKPRDLVRKNRHGENNEKGRILEK